MLVLGVGGLLGFSGTDASPLAQRTYTQAVLHQGQKLTWPRTAPLTLAITGTPHQQALLRQALAAWLQALPQPLQVQPVDDPAQAKLHVTWQPLLAKPLLRQGDKAQGQVSQALLTAGLTEPRFKNGHLTRVKVSLATTDRNQQPLNDTALYNVALHELGHALGLLGHSPHPLDVMVAERDEAPTGAVRLSLSPADVATLQALYTPDVGASATNLAALRADVLKLDAEARQRPTATNLLNVAQALLALGNAYHQQGEREVAKGLWQQAYQWCRVSQQRYGSQPAQEALLKQVQGRLAL
jgi:predicted Zn-dependent protease